MQPDTSPPKRVLSVKDVIARTALSRSTIGRLIKDDQFPKPLQLSVHRIGFLEADVLAWIDAKSPRSSSEEADAATRAKRVRGSGRHSKTAEVTA